MLCCAGCKQRFDMRHALHFSALRSEQKKRIKYINFIISFVEEKCQSLVQVHNNNIIFVPENKKNSARNAMSSLSASNAENVK